MEKAFIYLRVSSQGQIDGYGFDRQEEECRDMPGKLDLRLLESTGRRGFPEPQMKAIGQLFRR